MYDVIIVGGGIVGCSTALQILKSNPTMKIAILEKESKLAAHQTGHNSGVIHAGVYYKPGTMKAKFCREGCEATKKFCQEYNIPYKVPGKLIAATSEQELHWMTELERRCHLNGLNPIKLTSNDISIQQPGLKAVGGLFVQETGIVDWTLVCKKYAEIAKKMGAEIFYEHQVINIKENSKGIKIKTTKDQFECAYLITCAGLHSDRLVKLSGLKPTVKIIPFRGEYYQLSNRYNHYFNHLIYPVPNPEMPFLGVHFTPQISGITTVGPNAVLALAKEGYHLTSFNLKDSFDILSYPALYKMLSKNLSAIKHELCSSFSKRFYLNLIRKYFPDIRIQDLTTYPAGVRAQAMDAKGNLIDDFLFNESDRILHVCNAPSPAATSSIPIGKHIANKLMSKIDS